MNNNNNRQRSGPSKSGRASLTAKRGRRGGQPRKSSGNRLAQSPLRSAYRSPFRAPTAPSVGISNNLPAIAGSAYATGQETTAPQIFATRDSSRIIHRELVGNIVGSVNFAVPQSLSLNPGLSATFPWLASQAQAWEQYRFNKLEFKYYTRTGSQTPGSIMLIPDYDAADASPGSEQIASTYEDVTEDAPWKDQCCTLRPRAMHPMGPKKFVRNGPLAANLDIKTYDAGNLFVGTTDGTAIAWGKLWVEYDVSLYTPQLPPTGVLVASQHITGATPTTTQLLSALPVNSAGSSAIANTALNVVTFLAAGDYLIEYLATGTTITQTGAPAVSASGSFITTFGLAGTGLSVVGSGGAEISQSVALRAVVGTTVTFNNTVVAGLLSEMIISQLPPNLV